MRVKDFMIPIEEVSLHAPEASIEAVAMTMKVRNQGCCIIQNDEKEVGIITMRDVLEVYLSGVNPEDKCETIMNSELYFIDSEETREKAAQDFITHNVHHLLVQKQGKFCGIISTLDVIKDIAKDAQDHFPYLRRMLNIETQSKPISTQITEGISKLAEKLNFKSKK